MYVTADDVDDGRPSDDDCGVVAPPTITNLESSNGLPIRLKGGRG